MNFGQCFGFWGGTKHTFFTCSEIGSEKFPRNHPHFPRCEWWGLNFIKKDKKSILSLANVHVRECKKDFGKFPVLSDGKTGDVRRDYGGTIKRLYEKIPKSDRTDRFYRKIAKCGSKFCTNAYIGKGKIRERFQFAFKLFGISNWETIRPNALRSVFITKLANDPSINIEETMAAARHGSVAASIVYWERTIGLFKQKRQMGSQSWRNLNMTNYKTTAVVSCTIASTTKILTMSPIIITKSLPLKLLIDANN